MVHWSDELIDVMHQDVVSVVTNSEMTVVDGGDLTKVPGFQCREFRQVENGEDATRLVKLQHSVHVRAGVYVVDEDVVSAH